MWQQLLAQGISDSVNLASDWIGKKWDYDKSIEAWNRTNEYNSPSAVMQRLKDAGLNPNLVYGHGNAVNTAQQAPFQHAPSRNVSQFDYIGSKMAQAQIDNLRAQNENLVAQRDNVRAQTLSVMETVRREKKENDSVGDSIFNRSDYPALRLIPRILSLSSPLSSSVTLQKVGEKAYDSVSSILNRSNIITSSIKDLVGRAFIGTLKNLVGSQRGGE
ncbi:MAG: hypothetical protein LBQ47_03810 [Endomicrobium sp.]|jgi:hypothetical protein|nr:hypothetical protein [Endomicrobium sp.]